MLAISQGPDIVHFKIPNRRRQHDSKTNRCTVLLGKLLDSVFEDATGESREWGNIANISKEMPVEPHLTCWNVLLKEIQLDQHRVNLSFMVQVK